MDDATKEELLEILNEKQEEIEWLKAELDEANHSRELSDADSVTLRKERDEARREVCWFHHLTGFLAGDYANSRGWNYLNDERRWSESPQSESPQSVADFKLFLEGQDKIFLERIDRITAERDEARREVCNMNETGLRMNESDKKREAKRRGWDCFKENTNG